MYNRAISTRITSLCGFQPSSVVLCIQNSDHKTKLHVSMDPRHHLWSSARKTACIASEILVSMGLRPFSVVLCMKNSDFRTRHTSLYGSQTSSVILCIQNSVPSIRITSLYGSQHSSVAFACKTTTFGPE